MLQYPVGSKMRSASAWVYTHGTYGVVVGVGGGFAGVFAGGSATILSKQVVISASCATKLAMSVLSLVAAVEMLSSANAMAALSMFASVALLALRRSLD